MNDILPKFFIFGQSNTGKTTMIQKFKENIKIRDKDSSEIPITQTSGAILDTEIIEKDITEEDTFTISQFNVFVAVYDITNRKSFELISNILNQYKSKQPTSKKFINLIIVGNKCELIEQREIPEAEGIALSKEFKQSLFFEVSSNENLNVNPVFIKAADAYSLTSGSDADVTCGCQIY